VNPRHAVVRVSIRWLYIASSDAFRALNFDSAEASKAGVAGSNPAEDTHVLAGQSLFLRLDRPRGGAPGGGPIAIRRGQSGVAFASSAQARGCVVTTILMLVGIAIVPGVIWLVMRSVLRDERASRQRFERRREAWRAGGSVGPGPGGCSGGGGSDGGGGCGGGGSDGGGGCGGGGCGGGGCGGGGN